MEERKGFDNKKTALINRVWLHMANDIKMDRTFMVYDLSPTQTKKKINDKK